MPNPLRLAVIAERHLAVVRLPFPPAAVQRIGLAVGAALGRARRYGPCYGTDAGTPAIIELGAASMAVASHRDADALGRVPAEAATSLPPGEDCALT